MTLLPFDFGKLLTLIGVLALLYLIFRLSVSRSRRAAPPSTRPAKALICDWTEMRLDEADGTFRRQFSDLDRLASHGELRLLRLGLFNTGAQAIEPADLEAPVSVSFGGGAEVVSAAFTGAARGRVEPEASIKIYGARIELPPLWLDSDDAALFSIVLRGGDGSVESTIELRETVASAAAAH